jgi:hypothetical protein
MSTEESDRREADIAFSRINGDIVTLEDLKEMVEVKMFSE